MLHPTLCSTQILKDSRLQNKVIDLEVAASTPSPTIDPSVHTVLIGHSMGGIVAAETLLSITSDTPILPSNTPTDEQLPSTAAHSDPASSTNSHNTLMFPYIAGILAFDTPYLGLNPSVIAHGAESHYRTASGAYAALTDVAGVFGFGAAAGKASSSSSTSSKANSKTHSSPTSRTTNAKQDKLLAAGPAEAMSASMTAAEQDAAATPTWQRWGKYAMFAGAAGAVAAGGAAAYLKREKLSEGWDWVGSHLEFVGCLAKGEELKVRLEKIVALNQAKGIGFRDLVTVLGRGAMDGKKAAMAGSVGEGGERTFCTIPKREGMKGYMEYVRNDGAKDETEAHMTMFERGVNSGYFALVERAKSLLAEWVEKEEWYRTSDPKGQRDDCAGLMDVDLDEGEESSNKTWATGEEPVFVEKGGS